jgi:hypothetical protein
MPTQFAVSGNSVSGNPVQALATTGGLMLGSLGCCCTPTSKPCEGGCIIPTGLIASFTMESIVQGAPHECKADVPVRDFIHTFSLDYFNLCFGFAPGIGGISGSINCINVLCAGETLFIIISMSFGVAQANTVGYSNDYKCSPTQLPLIVDSSSCNPFKVDVHGGPAPPLGITSFKVSFHT